MSEKEAKEYIRKRRKNNENKEEIPTKGEILFR